MKLDARPFLFLFSLAVYLLAYGGTFHNPADEWLMMAAAESLAKHLSLDVNQMFWVGEHMGLAKFGVDGSLYAKHSLAQSILAAPLFRLGVALPSVGSAQVALLLGALASATTNVVLFAFVRRLGYTALVALVVTLSYALGTSSLVYAKTFASEPLSALALLVAGYLIFRYQLAYQQRANLLLLGAGLALGLGLLAKPTNAAVLPVFAAAMLWCWVKRVGAQPSPRPARGARVRVSVSDLTEVRGSLLALGLPILVLAAAAAMANYSRFGNVLATGYDPAQEGFTTFPLLGIGGLLASPGRGLFLYSPVLLLALAGMPTLVRRQPLAAWLALGTLAAYLAVFGSWHAWHGGSAAWGPRFLVPVLPSVALFLAPVVARAGQRRSLALLFGAVLALSMAIQVSATAFTYMGYVEKFATARGITLENEDARLTEVFFDPLASPLLHQWQFIAPRWSDLAWLYVDPRRGSATLDRRALAAGLLAVVVTAGLLALSLWQGRNEEQGRNREYGIGNTEQTHRVFRIPYSVFLVACSLFLLGSALVVGAAYVGLERYTRIPYYDAPDLRHALAVVAERVQPGDGVVILDPFTTAIAFNFDKTLVRRYGLSREDWPTLRPQTALLLEELGRRHPRLWLLAGVEAGEARARTDRVQEWLHEHRRETGAQALPGYALSSFTRP